MKENQKMPTKDQHIARLLKQAKHYAYLNRRMLDDKYDDELDLDLLNIGNLLIQSYLLEATTLVEK